MAQAVKAAQLGRDLGQLVLPERQVLEIRQIAQLGRNRTQVVGTEAEVPQPVEIAEFGRNRAQAVVREPQELKAVEVSQCCGKISVEVVGDQYEPRHSARSVGADPVPVSEVRAGEPVVVPLPVVAVRGVVERGERGAVGRVRGRDLGRVGRLLCGRGEVWGHRRMRRLGLLWRE